MSEKRKRINAEWDFFKDEDGNIKFCPKCKRCVNKCKQSYRVTIVVCPKFRRADHVRK